MTAIGEFNVDLLEVTTNGRQWVVVSNGLGEERLLPVTDEVAAAVRAGNVAPLWPKGLFYTDPASRELLVARLCFLEQRITGSATVAVRFL